MFKKLGCAIGSMVLMWALSGCGTDSSAPVTSLAPTEPATGIGPEGGTVTGSNGATITVPAGALSQTVDLGITQIDAATASVPEGVTVAGAVYALTPHGTSFAQPVTVTVPIDMSRLQPGDIVLLLKTTDAAQTQWEPLMDATVSGASVSAQISTFSNLTPFVATPTITEHPASVTLYVGEEATFSVAALDNGMPPLTYQWLRNGEDIPGATGASYTLDAATGDDHDAEFSVVVRNAAGTVTSAAATLTLTPPDLTGTWTSTYECTDEDHDEKFTGEDVLTIRLEGDRWRITSSDRSGGYGEFVGPATVEWQTRGPGYRENGEWIIRDVNTMDKTSRYENDGFPGGGPCNGTIRRNP